MLVLDNRTPYAAERSFLRDPSGATHWVVAVKATFSLLPNGQLELADEQLPPLLAPEYWGDPGVSSIRYEADLTLMKPETDVLINGSAHAPQGKKVKDLRVRLRFEAVDKSLIVTGPNVYHRGPLGIGTTEPIAFDTLPLRYEVAYGGCDTSAPDPAKHRMEMRNPVGVGFAISPQTLDRSRAPSVMYTKGDPSKGGPAGFGAIASYWSPRLELAGTYDARWNADQRPLLPLDWKPHSLLCAPRDQRAGTHLHGNELFELTHLAQEAILRFTLPRVYLTYATHFGSRVEEHRSKLASVIIEPDDKRVLLVWLTTLTVPLRQVDYLDKTVIKEKAYVR